MFALSYAFWGAILVVDQLLLPMFHLAGFPYKVSYFLVAIWGLNHLMVRRQGIAEQERSRDFRQLSFAFAGIIGCAVLGELLLALNHSVPSYTDAINGVLFYILAALAFGLGLSSKRFSLKILIWVFYAAVGLNLAFIFLRSSMPSWLSNFYFSQLDVQYLNLSYVGSVQDILDLARPRGYFSNPDGSALAVNIIVLFIYLGFRKKLLSLPSPVNAAGIIFFPIVTSLLLASRGEFIVSVVLAALNFRVIFGGFSKSKRTGFLGLLVLLIGIGVFSAQSQDESIASSFDRISSIMKILNQDQGGDTYEARNHGVARPLLKVELAYDRFSYSPIFGSGFSATESGSFAEGTHYFHNDWFRLAVTSGIIGVILMIWVIKKFCLSISIVAIIPWLLPGLVNSFMLNIAVFMFYFYMIGLFREKLRSQPLIVGASLVKE